MCGHQADVTCAAYAFYIKLVASSGPDAAINLWDFGTGRHVGRLTAHTSEVTVLKFLEPFAFLASADAHANICVWAVPPSADRFSCIKRLKNYVEGVVLSSCAVLVLGWDDRNHWLWAGDDAGTVAAWELDDE